MSGRTDAVEYLETVVYPAVFNALPAVFPEFGWERRGPGWQATATPPTVAASARRIACRPPKRGGAPSGFFDIGAEEATSWLAYLNGGSHPRGAEFLRLGCDLARRAGVDPGPLDARELTDAEARAIAERQDEARKRAELELRRHREQEALSRKRKLRQLHTLYKSAIEGHPAILAYLRGRGVQLEQPPPGWRWGRAWPGDFLPDETAILVPIADPDGIPVAIQRIFVDAEGRVRPSAYRPPGAAEREGDGRKLTMGVLGEAYGYTFPGEGDGGGAVVAIAEGPETAAAIWHALERRVEVCCCVSAGRLRAWAPRRGEAGAAVRVVLICGDVDRVTRRGDRPGQDAAIAAADRLTAAGLQVHLALPRGGVGGVGGVHPQLVADERGPLPAEGVKSIDWLDVYAHLGPEGTRDALREFAAEIYAPAPPCPPSEQAGEQDGADGGSDDGRGGGGEGGEGGAGGGREEGEPEPGDPEPPGPILPKRNLARARWYLMDRHSPPALRRKGAATDLICYAGQWYRYDGRRYEPIEPGDRGAPPDELLRDVRHWAEPRYERRVVRDEVRWGLANLNEKAVADVVKVARGEVLVHGPGVDAGLVSRFWMPPTWGPAEGGREGPLWRRNLRAPIEPDLPECDRLIALANGLLDRDEWVAGRVRMLDHTPRLFNQTLLPFGLDAARLARAQGEEEIRALVAELAPEWLAYLDETFEAEEDEGAADETVREFQKWAGYLLTTDTSHHFGNIAVWVGNPGHGKGTARDVLQALLGKDAWVPCTLGQLTEPYQLASWVGKQLAVFADAELPKYGDGPAAVEILKNISGEDDVAIRRMYLGFAKARLSTRILLICNSMPNLPDRAQAFERRMVVFSFKRKPKRSDPSLRRRLLEPRSMEGILIWALQGLRYLHEDGGFRQPRSGAAARQDFLDASSPAHEFVDEWLEIVQGRLSEEPVWLPTAHLGRAYRLYLEETGKGYAPDDGVIIKTLRPILEARGWRGEKKRGRMPDPSLPSFVQYDEGEDRRTERPWGWTCLRLRPWVLDKLNDRR